MRFRTCNKKVIRFSVIPTQVGIEFTSSPKAIPSFFIFMDPDLRRDDSKLLRIAFLEGFPVHIYVQLIYLQVLNALNI